MQYKSHTHTHTHAHAHTHLAEGALSQDLAQFKLPRVGPLRPLLHVQGDVDLLHGDFLLWSTQTHAEKMNPYSAMIHTPKTSKAYSDAGGPTKEQNDITVNR